MTTRNAVGTALGVAMLWGLCGWMDYGFTTKRANDFCLMWSRQYYGMLAADDWCERWRSQDLVQAGLMATFGPLALPAAVSFAMADGPLFMEFEHIDHAYPGRGVER